MNKTVYIRKLDKDFSKDKLSAHLKESISKIGLDKDFSNAKSIFIKPNLTYPYYKKGVTTSKLFIEGLVKELRHFNNSTTIYIGEGEAGYSSFSMTNALKTMGFLELEKYPNVEILNLSEHLSREIELETTKGGFKINLPRLLLDDVDFSISCPVPKVHAMTGISLAFKNLWGCLPDNMRLKNHYMFDYIISKIAQSLKFKYAFLDGEYGLNENGPMTGKPVELDWFVASNSMGAFDYIITQMMGISWKKIRHLRVAFDYGYIPSDNEIIIDGDPKGLKKEFNLKRNLWNYPAFLAFRSKKLTYFFYLSKWANILHKAMYLVRKKPIE